MSFIGNSCTMIAPKHQHTSLYVGSSSAPIVFAEIVPIVLVASENERYCPGQIPQSLNQRYNRQTIFPLTSFGVKQFLLRETRRHNAIAVSGLASGGANGHQFFIRWKEDDTNDSISCLSSGYFLQSEENVTDDLHSSIDGSIDPSNFPLVYIPSENPTILDRQPCCIIAYAHRNHAISTGARKLGNNQVGCTMCHISQDTLIRILPPRLATKSRSRLTASAFSSVDFRRESMLHDIIGEDGCIRMADEMIDELIQNHNEETIQELTLKMSAAIASIKISTTRDAFRIEEQQRKQMRKIEQSLRLFSMTASKKDNTVKRENVNSMGVKSWPSLIVHSPNHGDGKTLLVHALAKRLECSSIYLIRPGALLAKYGTRADSALESQLHAILISAACRNAQVCIILDQLDVLLPARLSGRSSAGDAATPVFNSIASYLRKITGSMQRKREFPFPLKNPLYNPTGCDGSSGQVLDVKFCLVGIVTCPDDGWKSNRQNQSGSTGGSSSILDCMVGDRYRLPLLKAKTILLAFGAAFAREGISLEDNAEARLAAIASSAPWAKGSVFRRVAKQVKWALDEESVRDKGGHLPRNMATLRDLEQALAHVNASQERLSKVVGQRKDPTLGERDGSSSSHFGSIGGNESAKVSLEDALAFDPKKRYILSKFGLSPPTGVLLYGPPGCGKTLLAKAVAKIFEVPGAGAVSTGGTFISLSISEIVSSEVGTSEKTIAASFEFAEKNAPSVSIALLVNLVLFLCMLSLTSSNQMTICV